MAKNNKAKFKPGERVRHTTEDWAGVGTITSVREDYTPPRSRVKRDNSTYENTDPESDLVKLSKLHKVLE